MQGWKTVKLTGGDPIQSQSVNPTTAGELIELDPLSNPIAISSGTNHSFFVFSPDLGVVFSGGTEGSVLVENAGEMVLYGGRACIDEFSCGTPNLDFNGRIVYGLNGAGTLSVSLFIYFPDRI